MLALLVLWFTAVYGEYMFTLPQTMEAGSTTAFCLIMDDLEDYAGLIPEQDYTVTVDLEYSGTFEGVFSIQQQSVKFKRQFLAYDFHACSPVDAPRHPGATAAVNVTITYKPEGQPQEVTDAIFSASRDLSVDEPELITLIQTDKPIYKPGETVRFRVMTMDYKLRAKTDDYEEITIESPGGIRVMQWKDIPAIAGFVSLEMPLSSDPVLGGWIINVIYGSKMHTQYFAVDEYVLPKFEVTVTPPKYLLPTTKTISGTVCAKYTYGKPVKGRVKIEICYGPDSRYYYYEQRPCGYIISEIDGCYEFFLDADDILLSYREYGSWGQLKVNATVTEEETGIELTGSSTGPELSLRPLNLMFEDDSDNYFKPGFPYKGRVIVTNPDESPAPGEEIRVKASYYDADFVWSNNFTSDENGVVHFTITDIDSDFGVLSLSAEAVLFQDDWRYSDNDPSIYYSTYRPRTTSSIRKWFSPSNSYIYIPDVDEKVDCGTELFLDVYYSAELKQEYTFTSIIRAGDTVVSTSKRTLYTTESTFDLGILSVEESQILVKEPRHATPSLPPLPPEPEPYDGTNVTATEEPMAVTEEIIVPQVAPQLGDAEPRQKGVGHFQMAVPVSTEMSPSARVLVFYIREDKEVVASSLEFDIKRCFKNKVSMAFEETTVHPGADTTLNLAASPRSTCFLSMVDKSVHLLDGDNTLTPEQVYERVERARPKHYISYWRDDREYCEESFPSESRPPRPPSPEFDYPYQYYPDYGFQNYATPEGVDAVHAFRDVEMWVVTDFVLETRPCKRAPPRPLYRGMPGLPGSGVPQPFVSYDTAVAKSDSETSLRPETEQTQPVKVRSLFPETWLWDIVTTGDDGALSMTTVIPDTITEWVGNTVCAHATDGIGVSSVTGVTAFQPFFISLTLPYSAVRGETLPVLVTVFNYLEDCVTMELRMKANEGFQFTEASGSSRQFCLCGGQAESTKFHIIPTLVGHIDLEVTALSIENSGLCDNVVLSQEWLGVSDGVQRQLLIEAEGVPQDQTTGAYVCVKDGANSVEKFEMTLPEDLVPESQRATLSVVGDVMGPTLSNLKNLLRMPYGCGEQNMASWAPNIYVLQYLSGTNQLTEELEEEAEGYMRVGYQRQLKYRHNDNSYSAWGENEYGNATGSLWLTAFVVKSMAQSSNYIDIDEEDIKRGTRWLVDKQEDHGCFPQVGKVFSSYLKGGLSGESPAGLTAFTLIALMEADLGFIDEVRKGFEQCLDAVDVETLDTYTLSLMLYAYTLHDLHGPRRAKILQELEKRKTSKEAGRFVYWERAEQKPADNYWYRAPSAEVEMTAYVLMSRLDEGQDVISDVQPVVQWLTRQRNPYGGFSSTQDTVVALQALAMFGSMTYSGDLSVSVEVKNSRLDHVFTVNTDNNLLYQSVDVQPDDGAVEVTASGRGCILTQLNLKYNIYKEDIEGPAFDVDVQVYGSTSQKNACHMRTLEICSSYLKHGGVSNMAIAEVKMPTGWTPVSDSLQKLVSDKRIEKFEVDKNYVEIYFDELTRNRLCVEIEVSQEIQMEAKPSLVTVYDYYETTYKVTHEYEITTTCGTTQKVLLDSTGLDCQGEKCQEATEDSPLKCPSCIDSIEETELETLTCNSDVVYKAIVGRSGDYSIKLKANLREKEKVTMDTFVNFKMDKSCKCPMIDSDTESKALIFTDGMALNTKKSELRMQSSVTVLKATNKYEKFVRQVASKLQMCPKL